MWYSAVGGVVTLIVSLLVTPFVACAAALGRFPGSECSRSVRLRSLPRRVSARAARAWLHRGPEYRHRVPLCTRGGRSVFTLAAELLRLDIDVLVVAGTVAAQAAQALTTTVPIVFTLPGDPVGSGLVASLARPAGMPRGCPPASWTEWKQLELPKTAVPHASRVAVPCQPAQSKRETGAGRHAGGGPGSGRGVARPGGTPAERHGERVCGADGVPRPSTRSPIRCSAPDSPNWHSWPPRTACRPFT